MPKKEVNPFDAKVMAASQLAAAQGKRAELYNYLRRLKDEQGYCDVRPATAAEIAGYTSQQVWEKQGFSAEEVAHINAEIASAYDLELKAHSYFRS